MTARDDKEKERLSRETLGKFFYDLAKTCFAAMVVTNAIALVIGDGENNATWILLLVGIAGTFIFARVGYIIIKNKNMEGMIITLGGAAFCGLCFMLWMEHTKSGRKWLEDL